MSKILIIPDVHGRDFWIEPCSHYEDYDKIVFLGDFHDPYTFQVSQDTSRHRLRDELLPFILEHEDKVICILGNHDCNYLVGDCANRIDHFHREEIAKYMKQIPFQLIYETDGYLFSHSGVLPTWLELNGLTVEDLKTLSFDHPALMQVSPNRGGWGGVGSCVWGDLEEYHYCKHLPDYFQIFGHTQLSIDEGHIEKDFACLDCRCAYVLNTETKELKKYETETN